MTNKEKFLIDNVGFHYEDLSLIRQTELDVIKNELGVSKDWMLLALSRDTVDNWNHWGFTLMRKPDFKKNIDLLEKQINNLSEEKFEKENNRKNQKNPQLYVDEKTFRKKWEAVKKQGCLYTAKEAEARNLSYYYTYNSALNPERYSAIDLMIAQDTIDENNWNVFVMSIQEVKVIEISI